MVSKKKEIPNGTLVKKAKDPTIYRIDYCGRPCPICSGEAINKYVSGNNTVAVMEDEELAELLKDRGFPIWH